MWYFKPLLFWYWGILNSILMSGILTPFKWDINFSGSMKKFPISHFRLYHLFEKKSSIFLVIYCILNIFLYFEIMSFGAAPIWRFRVCAVIENVSKLNQFFSQNGYNYKFPCSACFQICSKWMENKQYLNILSWTNVRLHSANSGSSNQ